MSNILRKFWAKVFVKSCRWDLPMVIRKFADKQYQKQIRKITK